MRLTIKKFNMSGNSDYDRILMTSQELEEITNISKDIIESRLKRYKRDLYSFRDVLCLRNEMIYKENPTELNRDGLKLYPKHIDDSSFFDYAIRIIEEETNGFRRNPLYRYALGENKEVYLERVQDFRKVSKLKTIVDILESDYNIKQYVEELLPKPNMRIAALVVKPVGGMPWPIHRDGIQFLLESYKCQYPYLYLNIQLTDSTKADGGLQVFPTTHRIGTKTTVSPIPLNFVSPDGSIPDVDPDGVTDRDELFEKYYTEYPDAVSVLTNPGDVVVRYSDILHGSLLNKGTETRYTLHLGYESDYDRASRY